MDFDFRFVIYTNLSSADSYSCLEPYVRKLGAKLELRHSIPRLDLIYCLSSMDFIVNVNNASENQIPSKLIDYKLSGRPILKNLSAFVPMNLPEKKRSIFPVSILEMWPVNLKNW